MAKKEIRYTDGEPITHRLQAGDEHAFTSVFREYHQRVYYFALKFVTEQDAKDVTAECFIQLWNKRAELKNTDSISGFLFVTARNRCFNLLRQQTIHSQKHTELLHELEQTEAPDLFVEQVRAELIGLIRDEVAKLPARMQEIFLLSFEEGLKPAEIASRLQLSVQTVSNQKLTAIRLLREALGPREIFLLLLVLGESGKIPAFA